MNRARLNSQRPRVSAARNSKKLRKESRFTEDAIALICIVCLTSYLVIDRDVTSYVPLVFGCCAGIGWMMKVVLGPSLRISYLTLPAVFLATYFLLMSIASISVYKQMDHYIKDTYFLAIQSVLITFPLGVVFANACFDQPNYRISQFARSRILLTLGDIQLANFVSKAFWAAIGVAIAYVAYVEFVPILKIFFDFSSEIDDISLRFSVTEVPRVLLFCLALSRSLVLPLCVLYLFFMSREGGVSWRHRFYFVFISSLIIASLTLERAPPMALCMMLLFGVALHSPSGPFGVSALRGYAIVLSIALLLTGLISAFQYSSDVNSGDVRAGVEHVVANRILNASALAAAWAFEEFPDTEHQLRGQYVRMFALLSGGEYLESRYAPKFVILPVSFVGDLWRNWGWPAVLIGGCVLGFIFQWIQLTLFYRKNITSSVFQAILMLACIWLIPGNAFGIMTTTLIVGTTVFGYFTIKKSLQTQHKKRKHPRLSMA
jgi:hypothetical protein